MNIKELKELIQDLPDDMKVIEAYDGPTQFGVCDTTLEVVTVYLLDGEHEWIEPFPNKQSVPIYKALCYRTW